MQATLINSKLKEYIHKQLDTLAKSNPIIGFTKPVISRIVDNNFYKVNSLLGMLSDSTGNIDIENILPEMIESIMKTDPFIYSSDLFGDIEIGGGNIKLSIPYINKKIMFDESDFESLKSYLL